MEVGINHISQQVSATQRINADANEAVSINISETQESAQEALRLIPRPEDAQRKSRIYVVIDALKNPWAYKKAIIVVLSVLVFSTIIAGMVVFVIQIPRNPPICHQLQARNSELPNNRVNSSHPMIIGQDICPKQDVSITNIYNFLTQGAGLNNSAIQALKGLDVCDSNQVIQDLNNVYSYLRANIVSNKFDDNEVNWSYNALGELYDSLVDYRIFSLVGIKPWEIPENETATLYYAMAQPFNKIQSFDPAFGNAQETFFAEIDNLVALNATNPGILSTSDLEKTLVSFIQLACSRNLQKQILWHPTTMKNYLFIVKKLDITSWIDYMSSALANLTQVDKA